MEEQEIIEVDSVDKSIHEAQPNLEPKKAKHEYGKRIAFFTKIDYLSLRLFFPIFLLSLLLSWSFWICYSQRPEKTLFLVLLCIAASFLALSILLFASHFLWKSLIQKMKDKDLTYGE